MAQSLTDRAEYLLAESGRVEVGDCWHWCGPRINGYGATAFRRVPYRAHRLVWEGLVGPIPDGLDLDHLCRNRACVNPDHMEPVTRRENERRKPFPHHNARKTHCKRGHAFTDENTLWCSPQAPGRAPRRQCRACVRMMRAQRELLPEMNGERR